MDPNPLTLVQEALETPPPEELLRTGVQPEPTTVAPGDARAAGETALVEGRVGVIMLAGGLSTRMGGANRLGLPIGPVTERTLLELQLHKIAAVTARYGTNLPVVVVTSKATIAHAKGLLARYRFGGLPSDSFRIAVQPSLPVVDARGAPASDDSGVPMTAPAGCYWPRRDAFGP